MTTAPVGIGTLSFLTPGNFRDEDPYAGLEQTLRLFELGERLGFDGAWIRQRHLEHGVGSAAVFLAAAGQRTSRIELGSAVIPLGYESPFRLAEDLSLADVLSRGRLQAGVSVGVPPHVDLIGDLVFDGDWRTFDLSYGRLTRLIENLRGEFLGDEDTVINSPGNVQRPRLQPHSPGLADRIWLGAASAKSVRWAAENGLNLLTGNVGYGGSGDTGGSGGSGGAGDFAAVQAAQIAEYRRVIDPARPGRVALGRVVVPLDGADRATRQKYREYAASRHERTLMPQGERRITFAPDLVGTSEEILERLRADAAVAQTSELRLELPYEFHVEDYEQILHDAVNLIGPGLGWVAAAEPRAASV